MYAYYLISILIKIFKQISFSMRKQSVHRIITDIILLSKCNCEMQIKLSMVDVLQMRRKTLVWFFLEIATNLQINGFFINCSFRKYNEKTIVKDRNRYRN